MLGSFSCISPPKVLCPGVEQSLAASLVRGVAATLPSMAYQAHCAPHGGGGLLRAAERLTAVSPTRAVGRTPVHACTHPPSEGENHVPRQQHHCPGGGRQI